MSRISDALKITKFPGEAAAFFEDLYGKIEADAELYGHLCEAECCYFEDGDYECDDSAILEVLSYYKITRDIAEAEA